MTLREIVWSDPSVVSSRAAARDLANTPESIADALTFETISFALSPAAASMTKDSPFATMLKSISLVDEGGEVAGHGVAERVENDDVVSGAVHLGEGNGGSGGAHGDL